ncbi:MAG: alpha/beta hydrolase [Candidatus Bathyarchaeia archaeon]
MEKPVRFYSENQRILGNLHLPHTRAPCVVTLHGLESGKDNGKWPTVAAGLYHAGYACLRFNFRGCGEGEQKSDGEFEDLTLTARIKDYKAALDHLETMDEVDTNLLGVVGSSFGGMVAVAAQDLRVKAVVTLGSPYKIPRFDEPRIPKLQGDYYILPSGRRFKKSFYEDLRGYDLLKAVEHSPPILVIHGSADETVPVEHAQKLYEHASHPKSLEIIEGADHVFSGQEHLDKAIELSLEWFNEYLQ